MPHICPIIISEQAKRGDKTYHFLDWIQSGFQQCEREFNSYRRATNRDAYLHLVILPFNNTTGPNTTYSCFQHFVAK